MHNVNVPSRILMSPWCLSRNVLRKPSVSCWVKCKALPNSKGLRSSDSLRCSKHTNTSINKQITYHISLWLVILFYLDQVIMTWFLQWPCKSLNSLFPVALLSECFRQSLPHFRGCKSSSLSWFDTYQFLRHSQQQASCGAVKQLLQESKR